MGFFYQCIIYGKPALILPHDYDQFDYAVRGVEAGVAFSAKRDNSKAIGQAFEELLAKENWPELETLRQDGTVLSSDGNVKREKSTSARR